MSRKIIIYYQEKDFLIRMAKTGESCEAVLDGCQLPIPHGYELVLEWHPHEFKHYIYCTSCVMKSLTAPGSAEWVAQDPLLKRLKRALKLVRLRLENEA